MPVFPARQRKADSRVIGHRVSTIWSIPWYPEAFRIFYIWFTGIDHIWCLIISIHRMACQQFLSVNESRRNNWYIGVWGQCPLFSSVQLRTNFMYYTLLRTLKDSHGAVRHHLNLSVKAILQWYRGQEAQPLNTWSLGDSQPNYINSYMCYGTCFIH